MFSRISILFALVALSGAAVAAKPKAITFGRWIPVKWMVGPTEDQPVEIKVRALNVNGEPQEFTMGEPRDITDRVFVVRRAFRINDSLPANAEPSPKPQWSWRPGGWLMVQRGNASISKLNLPEFDAYSSEAIWFRDYAAYCGISDDGAQVHAMVVQIGRKKPLLKKMLGPAKMAELPNSECEAPVWQKNPARVTFQLKGGTKVSFEIRSFAIELAPEQVEEESSGN
jgi:hypothetical protein